MAPVTPSITTSRIRREEPDDVPQIASKDKGKGRDLTNLGSSDAEEEIDEGEDDEEKKSDDEEEKELDVDLGDEEDGEPKKTDDEDDNEIDDGEVTNPADLPDSDGGRPHHSQAPHHSRQPHHRFKAQGQHFAYHCSSDG